ncbi:MAG TPA: hypothetical protein VMV69_18415, partial [Pirellulales bacterium]|nr:hypothetical protein [Pirellulales bacterium]
ITRMRSAGKLPDGERVGREYLYRADVIDAWLAAGTPDNATWRAMGGGGPTMRMPKDTPTGAPPLDAVPTTWHVPPELLAMRGIRREPLLAYIVLWQVVGCRPRKLTVDYLRLQRAMAASERAVRRWIETLAARGLIVVEAREPRQATIAVRDWRAAHDPAATRADAQLRLPIGDDSDDDADIAPIPIWHHRRPAGRRPDGPTPAG